MASQVATFRSFLSLKWKFLLILSGMLVALNTGMAYFAYLTSTGRLKQEQETIRQLKEREFTAVFRRTFDATSTFAYFVPRLVGERLPPANDAAAGRFVAALDEHGLMLNVEWAVEGLHVFSAEAVGTTAASWPRGRNVPPVRDALAAALRDDTVLSRLVCVEQCAHVTVLPLLERGVTVGVLVVEQAIGGILSAFNRLSGLDVAILRDRKSEGARRPDAVSSSAQHFSGETRGELVDRVLPALTGEAMAAVAARRPYRVKVDKEWYEVVGTDAVPAADGISVLLVNRVTTQVQALRQAITDSIWLGVVGAAVSEFVLLVLMWGPMRRMQTAIDTLGLLADKSYAQLRDHVPDTPSESGPRDEVEAMMLAIGRVADRMERLDESRSQAESRLRKSETGLQQAQSMARVVQWSGLPLKGDFRFAEGAEHVHPVLAQVDSWRGFIDLVHPEDRIPVLKAWRSGRPGSAMDVEFRLCRGEDVIDLHAVARFEAIGPTRVLRATGMMQDVSEMRSVQRELRSRQDRLEEQVAVRTQELASERNRAQRLAESKSQFLANMSHEIRTPLTAVLGLSQIGMQESKNRRIATTFEKILAAGDHLLHVVNDVLDLSKLDAGKVKIASDPFDLMHAVAQCIDMFRERAEDKGLALRLVSAEDLPGVVVGDRFRLQQVLINLLGNAIKFTDTGGVTLDVVRPSPGRLSFQVRDTGTGLSEPQLRRLFQPYIQHNAAGDVSKRGTGLGLTISRRVATLMGGDISVASEPGVGSLFTLNVPLEASSRGLQKCEPARGASPDSPQLSGLRVLVADDVAINRTVIEHLLSLEGASVASVSDGGEVLNALMAGPDKPVDIVLMDVQMPGMDGLEATRRIREAGIEVPIIGVTADVSDQSREATLEAGMQDRLTKPLMPGSLVSTILSHVGPRELDRPGDATLH